MQKRSFLVYVAGGSFIVVERKPLQCLSSVLLLDYWTPYPNAFELLSSSQKKGPWRAPSFAVEITVYRCQVPGWNPAVSLVSLFTLLL